MTLEKETNKSRIRLKTKNIMSKQRDKFELFQRLQNLGFTYEESVALRRIEMTLQRWAERECGDANGNAIERDEVTGKPFLTYENGNGPRKRYPVADREAGALRRLKAIVAARNNRNGGTPGDSITAHQSFVLAYHQGDCRGCMLYIVPNSALKGSNGETLPLDQYYTRGVSVCC